MRSVFLTATLGVAFAALIGCDEKSAADARAEAESACPQPKPTCPPTTCSSTPPGEATCNVGVGLGARGTWQCIHDDPMPCRGCNGVTVMTYSCRAFQCPVGTCPYWDQTCVDALCPGERTDGGHDGGAGETPDAAVDASFDASAD